MRTLRIICALATSVAVLLSTGAWSHSRCCCIRYHAAVSHRHVHQHDCCKPEPMLQARSGCCDGEPRASMDRACPPCGEFLTTPQPAPRHELMASVAADVASPRDVASYLGPSPPLVLRV
jgi:hypothetical protein